MKYKIKIIDPNMGIEEYKMYQDIPAKEIGSNNSINGKSYQEYKQILKDYKENETTIDPKINSTTNRYIFYIDNTPVGAKSYRNMGYGTIMLALALDQCKKLGMTSICINCNDKNIASKRIIEKNGGKLLFNYGTSSRYKITLN